jgi:inner membrane protein
MSKRTHLAFALLLSAYLFRFSPQQLLFVPIVLISAMLPDLDLALRGFPLVEHRKTFHNIWFTAAAAYAILHLTGSPLVAELSSIGIISHLLMDSSTKVGVMWLYPLSKWKLSGPLRTGGRADTMIGILSLVGASYFIIF